MKPIEVIIIVSRDTPTGKKQFIERHLDFEEIQLRIGEPGDAVWTEILRMKEILIKSPTAP